MTGFSETSQAKIQLIQHQDRQSHIRHLYKLAISLGGDISNTVQQSVRLEGNTSSFLTVCLFVLTLSFFFIVFALPLLHVLYYFTYLKKTLHAH